MGLVAGLNRWRGATAGRRVALSLPDVVRGPIARGAAGTFLLRLLHAALRFLISLVLARLLGATGYGAYSFALTCVAVLTVPALLGFDGLLVREVAGYRPRGEWALLHGLMRCAGRTALVASVSLALAAAGLASMLSAHLERPLLMTLWIALLALPFLALLRIKQAILTGLRHVVVGQVAETVVQPALFLVLVGLVALMVVDRPAAPVIVGLYGVSILIAFIVAAAFVRRIRATHIEAAAPAYDAANWRRSGMRFALIAGLNVLGTSLGVIMLGPMQGGAATGVFGIAAALASLVMLPLMAINTALAPAVSARFAAGKPAELQPVATKAARSTLMLCLPLALVYVVFGERVLWLFGQDFTAGYTALAILSVAQVVNAAMGSAGTVLQMTGHERDVAIALALAIVCNVALNLALIPTWGVNGAAVGAAANVILWNVALVVQLRRRLGIRSTVLG